MDLDTNCQLHLLRLGNNTTRLDQVKELILVNCFLFCRRPSAIANENRLKLTFSSSSEDIILVFALLFMLTLATLYIRRRQPRLP